MDSARAECPLLYPCHLFGGEHGTVSDVQAEGVISIALHGNPDILLSLED